MVSKNDWQPWHDECDRFNARGTEGFTQDLAALKKHILKLQEVCPKDTAGWPHGTALLVIDKLQKQYLLFEAILQTAHPDTL